MSGATSSPAKAPKTMSSKLLTMKFMQRAAASSSLSIQSTPDQPSPKRRKIGDSSPENLGVESLADQRAVQAALVAEESKRQLALERQAAEAGDTRWVLKFKPDHKTQGKATIRVIETGFAAIDHALFSPITTEENEDASSERPLTIGRRSFGKFNRTIEKLQDPSKANPSDSDTDEDVENDVSGDDDPTGAAALIKAAQEANGRRLKMERKEKRKAEQVELLRLAEKRKKKDIKLNRLTSISGPGASKGAKRNAIESKSCFRCGQTGHLIAECPKEGS